MKKKKQSKAYAYDEDEIESDENFYFIAGYTPNGIPFGITWEQAAEEGLIEDRKLEVFPEEIPF